jgi:amino acid adenylation domain-containing protein
MKKIENKKEKNKKLDKKVLFLCRSFFNSNKINYNTNLNKFFNKHKTIRKFNEYINLNLNLFLEFKSFFSPYDIIQEIDNYIINFAQNKKNKTPQITIPKAKLKKNYPLSHAQRRMFVLYKLESDSSFYNINNIREISGDLKINTLQKAINKLIQRHEVFRTNFKEINGEPAQVIKKKIELKINNYELEENKNQEEQINKIIKKYTLSPFKLELDPLLRVTVIKKNKDNYIFIISTHHIIFDRFSMNIFYRELTEIYNSILENRKANLPELSIQYKDYAEWEQSKENQKRLKKQEKYWLKEFSKKLPVIDLHTDYPRPIIQGYEGRMEMVFLEDNLINSIKKIAKEKNVTVFSIFLTIFNLFLYKITNEKDIVIGTTMTNRSYKETENCLGLFLNTLPIRTKIDELLNFEEFLEYSKKNILNCLYNKEYPFEKLVEKLNLERDMSRNPMFNIFFEFINKIENNNKEEKTGFKDVKINFPIIEQKTVKFDIRFRFIEIQNDKIIFCCDYNTDLFKKETIINYLNLFRQLLKNTISNPKQKINDIKLLSNKEEKSIIKELSGTINKNKKNLIIQNRIAESFKKNNSRIAIEYKNKKIKYSELQKKSDIFYKKLISLKIKQEKDKKIVLLLDDKVELISAVIGALKAKIIFIPIEIDEPINRLKNKLRQVNARYIITDNDSIDKKLRNTYNVFKIKKIYREKEKQKVKNDNKITLDYHENDSVYIYFSSGSTGLPKAILGKNSSLTHFIDWEIKKFKINKEVRVSQLAPASFDASLRDFFVPLLSGATVCIPENRKEIIAEEIFKKWIKKNKINLLHTTPSVFRLIKESNKNYKKQEFKHLKNIILAGEKLSPQDLKDWQKEKAQIINMYGPTETTMLKTYYQIKKGDEKRKFISIGKPISETQIFILDKNLNILPKNIEGEIYISTPYMTKGYVDDPKKTPLRQSSEGQAKQVFLPHPFKKDTRIYKTGDLAKMHPDGNIEILGRVDHQIKIRGMRIEPGEIEANLRKHNNIKDVVVTAKETRVKQKHNKQEQQEATNDKYLIAYYTSNNKKKINPSQLKEKLKQNLPDYMIPNYFVHLAEMPLNQNGKLDRLNLPEPKEKDLKKKKYRHPRNLTEEKVLKIWQNILNIKKISIDDNFFDLGGHSLKAISLLVAIKKQFAIDFDFKHIFLYPTIKQTARKINDIIINISNN